MNGAGKTNWLIRPTEEAVALIGTALGDERTRIARHEYEAECQGACFGEYPIAVLVATMSGKVSAYCDSCYEASRVAAVVFLPTAAGPDDKPAGTAMSTKDNKWAR